MELKKCPFCGGQPVRAISLDFRGDKCYRLVYCRVCNATTDKVLKHGDSRDENSLAAQLAEQAWNRRCV